MSNKDLWSQICEQIDRKKNIELLEFIFEGKDEGYISQCFFQTLHDDKQPKYSSKKDRKNIHKEVF